MGLFQKDYLLRLLEQLADAIAAIVGRISAGEPREALEAIRQARATLAGPLASTLERVDANTVLSLLGADRARVYAALARLEGEARAKLGEEVAAAKASAWAEELERAMEGR
jgi:Flp pilus assembly protein TadB